MFRVGNSPFSIFGWITLLLNPNLLCCDIGIPIWHYFHILIKNFVFRATESQKAGKHNHHNQWSWSVQIECGVRLQVTSYTIQRSRLSCILCDLEDWRTWSIRLFLRAGQFGVKSVKILNYGNGDFFVVLLIFKQFVVSHRFVLWFGKFLPTTIIQAYGRMKISSTSCRKPWPP